MATSRARVGTWYTATRVRLTSWYAVILFVTMLVFSVALMSARRTLNRRQVANEAAELAGHIVDRIAKAQAEGRQLTFVDSLSYGTTPEPFTKPEILPLFSLFDLLDPEPGYFFLMRGDTVVYASDLVRQLGTEQALSLRRNLGAARLKLGEAVSVPILSSDSSRVLRITLAATMFGTGEAFTSPTAPRPNTFLPTGLGPHFTHVVGGMSEDIGTVDGILIVRTLLWLAPLILVLSAGAAYLVTAGMFNPVEELMNEVDAISGERSLHRRLPIEHGDDEISRLGATLNAMLERLEHSFVSLRSFTADASHELKTPLTVIRANIERAMHPETPPTERLVALEEALNEIARMSDLVDSLLALARVDEGRFNLVREAIPLRPLLEDVFETAAILGDEAGVQTSLTGIEDMVVFGDETRLRHLFLNLLTNAIKYTPSGGQVELGMARRIEGEVSIFVRDTGIGIAASDLPHVFDRFWRADRARSRASERGGSGLGLAIAQWIAQAHGGTLTVQSKLGRGSLFTVVLPAQPGTLETRGHPPEERAEESSPTSPYGDFTNS